MQVKDIAWVCFTTWGSAQQQRYLTVGCGVLGQVVVDDEGVTDDFTVDGDAVFHDFFTDGTTGVWCNVLQSGRFGRRSSHDRGVFHCTEALEVTHNLGDLGTLLTDSNVDTIQALALLVDDGVDGHCGFAGLAVTDDELTLTTTDGNHRVDGDDASLHGGIDRLAVHHTGSDTLDGAQDFAVDGTLTVDRLTEGIDDTTDQRLTNRNRNNTAGGVDLVAFLNRKIVTQDDGADRVLLEVQCNTKHSFAATSLHGELEELGCHDLFEAADAGHAVANGDDGTDIHHPWSDVGTLLNAF